MNKKNQKLLENLDKTLKKVQAKFVGPKFRYKNFPDTEAFKEFDSKRIISKSNLKRHWIITLVLMLFPFGQLMIALSIDKTPEAPGLLLFGWILLLMVWAISWWSSTKTCTHEDCKATRTKNFHKKVSETDGGIIGTYSVTTTNKEGVKTTRNYAKRKYLQVWQCGCCKREFDSITISKETI